MQNSANAKPGSQAVYYASGYYDQGPVSAQLVYRAAEKTKDNATDDGKKEWAIRGAYDFNVVKVGLLYQRQQLNTATSFTMADNTVNTMRKSYAYGGFVTVPFTPKFLMTLEAAKSKGDNSTGGYGYMLNAQYLFSKRTSIYGEYGYMKSRSENANNGIGQSNLAAYGNVPIEAGQHLNGFMAGILHTF